MSVPVSSGQTFSAGSLNEAGDFERHVKGGGSLESADFWLLASRCAFDKGGEFTLERFILFDFDFFFGDGHAVFAIDPAALILIVEGKIGVALKNADLAEAFGTDAARGDVGDTAILKPDPCVGDVFAARQHGYADGIDRGDGRVHEMQNDLEVMDHEIKNDPDVEAALGKGRETMALDELRRVEPSLELAHDRIKSLDVTDLEDTTLFRGEGDHGFSIIDRVGDGFFHEDVFTGGKQHRRDFPVRHGRGRDRGGIDPLDKLPDAADGHGSELFGELAGVIEIGIVDRDEIGLFETGVDTLVIPTNGSDPDDSDFDTHNLLLWQHTRAGATPYRPGTWVFPHSAIAKRLILFS